MYDPTYPLLPIFAFVGFVLVLVPLPWHLQAWNSGTCFYMIWASLACLNQFINSIIWANHALNVAPIWCEISIRIMMGASVALPASSLCINRRLYRIASVHSISFTRADKIRAIFIDTLICFVFPLVYIAIQYVVQGHRFNIFENIGCYPALYNTLLTYFLSIMWPIVIGSISAVYCVLSLISFCRRRAEFARFLSTNKTLTMGRYFRLMALAMTDILFTVPPAIFMMWLNATATPIGPWRSWADTHFAFSRIEQYPAVLWRSDRLTVIAFEFTRWVTPLCALIFFAFFGLAGEARKNYAKGYHRLLKIFRPRRSPSHVLHLDSKPALSPALSRAFPPTSPSKTFSSLTAIDEEKSLGEKSDSISLSTLTKDLYDHQSLHRINDAV